MGSADSSHRAPEENVSLQFQDELTRLWNRRWLAQNLPKYASHASAVNPLTLLLLDVDRFHANANGKYGEAAGDSALVQISKRIREAAPETAIVRYGGDAFLIILAGARATQASELDDRLRRSLASKPILTPKDHFHLELTFSAGIATIPDHAANGDALLDAAASALYAAKKSGRNRTCVSGAFDPNLAAEQRALATLPCSVYLGRTLELESALALLEELKAKHPALLFVQGEGGTGKSRFLREYADRSKAAGILYLYVCCSEDRKQTSAWALLHLIGKYYASRKEEHDYLRSKLNAPQRAIMRELVAPFASWPDEGAAPAQSGRKLLTLQAVEAAVVAMTDKAPLLILIDNAAHADRGTLDILRVILRDRKAAIGVVFAFKGDVRSIDARRDAALHEFVQEFERQQRMETLTLPPLKPEHLHDMIRAILPGATLPDGFLETLANASGGSPLYIEEAIRILVLKGRIRRTAHGWEIEPITAADMAGSLDTLIKSVLDQLPEGTGEVITNAAVVGTQFDVDTLQEVMGRREAAMYDAMDQTRSSGLIREDREGGKQDFEFTADHTRTVRYATTPDDLKQKIHKRVSEVLRVRNLDKPEVSLKQLTYHQAKAKGEEPPAEHEELEASKPQREARIPESKDALNADGLRRAIDMMRALSGLLRVGRLYPQWSQTADSFRTALQAAATALLEGAPVVTFALTSGGFRINGHAPEAGRAMDTIGEFEKLLAGRLVGTLTLKHGLESRELDALVAALAAPMDRSTVPPDHWDKLLDRDTIRNFDVLQQRYVSRAGDTMQLRGRLVVERALTPRELDLLWAAVRYLKAGADNLRMYPPGHALVETSMSDATTKWQELLATAQQVTLSSPEELLIVNSTPVDPKTAGDAAAMIAGEIRKKQLRSITLSRGVDGEELRALISLFALPDAKSAEGIIASGEFRSIGFGARTYQRVATGDTAIEAPDAVLAGGTSELAQAGLANVPTVESLAEIPASRIDLRARAWLAAPVDKFVSEVAEREIVSLVEALNFGAFADLALKLIDRLGRRLSEGLPPLRRRAVLMLTRAVVESQGETRALIMTRLIKPLKACLLRETDAEVLRAFVGVVYAWITKSLQDRRLNAAGDFYIEALKPKLEAPDCPRDFRSALQQKLHSIAEASEPVMDALRHGPQNQREAAIRVAGIVGPPLTYALVKTIKESDTPDVRKACAYALREIGGTAQADLAHEIRAGVDVEAARRVLSVLELAGNGSLATAVFAALEHPQADVREAGLALLTRTDRAVAAAVLRRTITLPAVDVAIGGLDTARSMLLHDLAPDVIKLAQATESDLVARSACRFLGECPSPSAVPALRRVFENRSRMLGFVKGFSDETRAAAIAAASKLPSGSARELVDEARNDRSDIVRRAAR